MNTKFHYCYRDASNYKQFGEVVFGGANTLQEQQGLESAFDEGRYFVAHQIGIPEVFFDYGEDSVQDDHSWHEYMELEPTDAEPTDPRTFSEFVKQVQEASLQGWEEFNNYLGSHL